MKIQIKEYVKKNVTNINCLLKILRFKTLLIIGLCSTQVSAQKEVTNKINQVKEDIQEIKNDTSLQVKGSIISGADYVIDPNGQNNLDYRLNVNLNLSYKGIDLPLQFNLSNGRTISNINGPNFRTPKFNNIGFSPSKGNWTLHFGNRSMNFSKYTYQNIRFKGYGIEYLPDNFVFKIFKGNLTYINPNENIFFSNIDPPFKRKSWGMQTGIITKTFDAGLIVFKAKDSDNLLITSSPSENVAIELNGKIKLNENTNITASRSLSALSPNTRTLRENILTHDTAYNLFGLFTKREGSKYNYANDITANYSLNNYAFSLTYLDIDEGYRSLGSLIYDNNFRALNFTVNGTPIEKLTFSSLLGIRTTKENVLDQNNRGQFQLNEQVNYKLNETLSFSANYSNVRNTQKVFQRRATSNAIDSLSLAQISETIRLGSTINLNEEKTSIINANLSWQKGLGIENDSISTGNRINNYMINANYISQLESHNLNVNTSYIINKNPSFTNKSLLVKVNDQWQIDDSNSINLTLGFNRFFSALQTNHQLNLRGEHEWQITDGMFFSNSIDINLGENNSLLNLNTLTFSTEFRWRFAHDNAFDLLKQ